MGDILFTRKGSFGNSAIVEQAHLETIISSEIMLLRLTSTGQQLILPEYLALFLNSLAGYTQVEQWVHGAAFYSVSQGDLGKIKIAILPLEMQKLLVQQIEQSKQAEINAKQLLEQAKRAVEIAIEEDEATALAYLVHDGGNKPIVASETVGQWDSG